MKNIIIIVTILISFTSCLYAQKGVRYKLADNYFQQEEFVKAVEIYEELHKKKPNYPILLRRLGQCYNELGRIDDAVKSYGALDKLRKFDKKDYLDYGLLLLKSKQYSEAFRSFEKYQKYFPEHSSATAFGKMTSIEELVKDSSNYRLSAFSLNSEFSDFSPVIYSRYKGDTLFSSNQRDKYIESKRYSRDETYFIHVRYETDKKPDNEFKRFIRKIADSKYHDGPLSFSPNEKTLFLTRNNTEFKKKSGSRVNLNLYTSTVDKGVWSDLKEVSINSNEYSVGHATFSRDGKTVYFVSDMPGGFGGTDIWKADFIDGSLANMVNLGKEVNTELNEMFPYITKDNNLIFSSEGHIGLGGLDLIIAFDYGDHFGGAKNMGYPLNTNLDDFGIFLDQEKKSGMISSNREGGMGMDDIYLFSYDHLPERESETPCLVINPDSVPIEGVRTYVFVKEEANWVKKEKNTTDTNGLWEIDYNSNEEYLVIYKHPDYISDTTVVKNSQNIHLIRTKMLMRKTNKRTVVDAKTGAELAGVNVSVFEKVDGEWVLREISVSDVDGKWNQYLDPAKSYKVEFEKEGYGTKSVIIPTSKEANYNDVLKRVNHFKLYPLTDIDVAFTDNLEEAVGKKLGDFMDINPIYFDYKKSNIRPDAAIELNKIVKLMNEHPTMVVELGAHTDCIASNSYNQQLSQRRAISSANYIKKRIKNPENIYGKGYGESQPINKCKCEECSEEERQLNRRTEFKIVKM